MTFHTRAPAVAGRFYPSDASELTEGIASYIDFDTPDIDVDALRAIIVPHAGYMYSGPIAGTAYSLCDRLADRVNLVVVAGPSHFVRVDGVATSTAERWQTPLGVVTLATEARKTLEAQHNFVVANDDAHADEHSIEVQVPFLQHVLTNDWQLLPLAVGHISVAEMAAVVAPFLDRDDALVVLSTDLSHYLTYEQARERDVSTAASVMAREVESIDNDDACGAYPLRGLLSAAQDRDLEVELLALASSGDTAGSHDRVVGYGSFALTELL